VLVVPKGEGRIAFRGNITTTEMKYTKIERVEFLLEEIKEILRSKDTLDAS
jgi:hypothetical protein